MIYHYAKFNFKVGVDGTYIGKDSRMYVDESLFNTVFADVKVGYDISGKIELISTEEIIITFAALTIAIKMGKNNFSATDYSKLGIVAPGFASKGGETKTGQIHHVLSNKIMSSLNSHQTLSKLFDIKDPTYKIQALSQDAHKGYQPWHRTYDVYVQWWLGSNDHATPEMLNSYYNNQDLVDKFGKVFFE